jgi:hypothetical protein
MNEKDFEIQVVILDMLHLDGLDLSDKSYIKSVYHLMDKFITSPKKDI